MTNTFELDDFFELFLDEFGAPTSSTSVPLDTTEQFRGKLPDRLLEYWQEYGFCGFMNGLFWIVNPADYAAALDVWLCNTPVAEEDTFYVIARTAFGELYLWGEKTGARYEISPSLAWIIQKDGNQNDISAGHTQQSLQTFFAICSPEDMDELDENEKPLFDACIKKLGAVEYDEVLAFEPALFLGGDNSLDNINKVNIFVHLDVLASFGERTVLDKNGLMQKAFGG